MGLNDRGGRGATGDTGSQWDRVFTLKSRLRKNNDLGICLEGRNRDWDPVPWRAEGSRECL